MSYLLEHSYLLAALILVAAIISAALVDRINRTLLKRLVEKTHTEIDDHLIKTLHRPLVYTFWV